MKKLINISIAIFIILACSNCKMSNDYELSDSERQEISNYFTINIEQDSLTDLENKYYLLPLMQGDYESTKEKIWQIWEDANIERLKEFPILDQDSSTSFIWTIPDNHKMQIQVFKKGEKPESGYSFFINLHGGGKFPETETAWGCEINDKEWEAAKILGKRYEDAPSLYFVPRMADDRLGRWYKRPQQKTWIRAWQLAVLSKQIDPNKTYIMGISQGGYGSFKMGTFFADYFAGIGPMAGPESLESAPIENLRNTPIRIEVGEFDSSYNRNIFGQEWKDRLQIAKEQNPGEYIHEVVIQEGRGHGINYYDVAPWLSTHSRNAYPDNLSFLYYDMDNTYRTGFGYIRLDKLNKEGKIAFKIEKRNNTFNIYTEGEATNVKGTISLYLDKVNFQEAIIVNLNNKEVFNKKCKQNIGTMIESLALFGDPNRIFTAKVDIEI